MSYRSFGAVALVALAGLVGYGCSAASGATNQPGGGGGNGSGTGGSGGIDGGGASGGAAGSSIGGSAGIGSGGSSGSSGSSGLGHCDPKNPDLAGCECTAGSPPRPCYPSTLDPATRHVGSCKDGTQQCTGGGEFPVWGNCTGAVGPATEVCNDGQDNDCNGKQDCGDPSCATFPGCSGSCTNGQTRPCYTGPTGTEGVGTCHAGTQTCTNGTWPSTCSGEVTPTAEVCTDSKDHNCNHMPGCLDFSCLLQASCQPQCKPDPGCVCPEGSGETATCPDGYYGITKNSTITNPGTVECCQCTASTCDNPGCCAEAACKGDTRCAGFQCSGTLPASCNGKVGFDCDDFPEDCDVTCCKCKQCPP